MRMNSNSKTGTKPVRRNNIQIKNKIKKTIAKSVKVNSNNKIGGLNNSIKTENILKYFKTALFLAVLTVVFYPPFFRGLYFQEEQFPAEIFVFVIFIFFWIYKLLKKDGQFLKTPIDYASFGFVIVYFISIFVAVALHLAISEWLKYCMYFSVFFMLSDLISTYKSKITVLWIILTSSLGVCVLGIDGAAGKHIAGILNQVFNKLYSLVGIEAHDTFYSTFVAGRITSTLQYPNTLAAYLTAVFFILLGLIIAASKPWAKAAAGAYGFMILITFIFTLSRGAYLILPIAAAAFIIFLPRGFRIKGVAYAFALVIPTGLIAYKLYKYISNPESYGKKIWLLILIGIVASAALTIITGHAVKWFERLSWKIYTSVISGLIIIAFAGILYLFGASIPLELSHSTAQADGYFLAQKKVILKPGRDYKLIYNVNAAIEGDKPNAYSIDISHKTKKDVIFYTEIPVTVFYGKATHGIEEKVINFRVPQDSMIVNIRFLNYYQGTKAIFYNAKIVDAANGKVKKNLILKYKYIPTAFTEMFEGIQANNSTVTRGIFNKDGLKIIKDHWLLGAGGGAWPLLYFSYQSYLYFTTQAHNYFLQLGVESGILGLIILALMLVSIFIMFISEHTLKRENGIKERILQGAIFTSILLMFMHASIDFDLSLSAVFLLLWELIGIFNAGYRNSTSQNALKYKYPIVNEVVGRLENLKKIKQLKLHPVIGILTTIMILILPAIFLTASGYAKNAEKAKNESNMTLAVQNMKKAASINPFEPDYKVEYAISSLKAKKSISEGDIIAANRIIRNAEKFSKYRSDVIMKIGSYYLFIGDFEKGLSFFDHATLLKPFAPQIWEKEINAYTGVVIYYFNKKDSKSAFSYIDRTPAIIDKAKAVNRDNLNPFKFADRTIEILEKMKYLKDNEYSGQVISIDKIIFYNMPEMDIDYNGIPDQWNNDSTNHIRFSYKNGVNIIENTASEGEFVESRSLSLLPGKNYKLQITFARDPGINSIPVEIKNLMHKTDDLKVEGSNNVYTTEISTKADFLEGNKALRLSIKGKYEIKNIIIFEE